MNAVTRNLPATQEEPNGVVAVKRAIASRSDEFKAALPSHISVDKFQRTVATAVLANPKLLECDRQSFLMSCMKLATDGLIPDGREAALVPFKTRVKDGNQWFDKWLVQPMPMAYGLRKKILQSGEVVSLQVGVAYHAELIRGGFIYEIGIEPPIRHRPDFFLTEEEAADSEMIAAYSIARIKNDTGGDPFWSVEVMSRREVYKVRQMSQTGALYDRNGEPRKPSGPWVDWESEMWKKTVLRRHSKVLPMSGDILDAINRDDEPAVAEGVGAMLDSAEGSKPALIIPGKEDLDGADPVTGEVVDEAAGNGLSDVDEETARKLDAGEPVEEKSEDRLDAEDWVKRLIESFAATKTDDERRSIHEQFAKTLSDLEAQYPDLHAIAMDAIPPYVERPQTDFTGANKPENAQHGQSWFNPSDGKTKYAVLTQHGIKWYLQAPTEGPYVAPEPEKVEPEAEQDPAASDRQDEEEAEDDDVQQAAAETVAAIDGPLTEEQAAIEAEPTAEEPAEEEPLYMGKVRELHAALDAATNKTAVNKVEQEYLRHCVAFSKDVADGLEVKMMTLKRKFAAAAAEG